MVLGPFESRCGLSTVSQTCPPRRGLTLGRKLSLLHLNDTLFVLLPMPETHTFVAHTLLSPASLRHCKFVYL